MAFGRKGLGGGQVASPAPVDGRQWMIDLLAPTDQPGSMEQAHACGMKLFDDAYQAMKSDRGVRIEDMAAMLGSVGGFLSLTAALDRIAEVRMAPQDIGMVVLRGYDDNLYFFGDAPNWLLCEAPYSLISLLFGAAHAAGAAVSLEILQAEMKTVAAAAGKPDFLQLGLPVEHRVDDPISWASHFTPFVKGSIVGGMAPPPRLPIVVGFALQQLIDVGSQSLDPMLLTQIAMKCALRASKVDPARVRQRQA